MKSVSLKNITSELSTKIEEILIQKEDAESEKHSKSAEALVLLEGAITGEGYDPQSIIIKVSRVLLKKDEVTVRFKLHPIGFVLAKAPPGYADFTEPEVLVHLKKNGDSCIASPSVSLALRQLVNPMYWCKIREKNISVLKPDASIERLDLSVATYFCLKRAGIIKIGDLRGKREIDLLKIPNFGIKRLAELKRQLEIQGIRPGLLIGTQR